MEGTRAYVLLTVAVFLQVASGAVFILTRSYRYFPSIVWYSFRLPIYQLCLPNTVSLFLN